MSSALWCVTNGRANAPPYSGCRIGVSTSRKPLPSRNARTVEMIRARSDEHLPHPGIDHQVDVPLAVPQLLVGERIVDDLVPLLVRLLLWRSGIGRRDLASSTRRRAWTETSPVLVRKTNPSTPMMSPMSISLKAVVDVPEVVALQVDLDASAGIFEMTERRLPHPAQGHDPAGHRHIPGG